MPSSSNKFAIFRIKKLGTPEEISKVGTHNDRRGKLPDNVDPSRVKSNRSFIKDDRPLLDRVQAKLAGKKYRHDAVKAVEIVCAFSPGCEKFVPLEEWAKSSIEFIKREFGAGNLVSAVLHLDEKTPHLQCVIVPLVGEKLAAKRIFGTRKQMRDLQTGYFKAVQKYGLARGAKGSDRPHLTMQEIYQGTQEGREILQKALDAVPKKSALQTWQVYKQKLDEHLTGVLEPLTTAKTAAQLAGLELESLRRIPDDRPEDRAGDPQDRLFPDRADKFRGREHERGRHRPCRLVKPQEQRKAERKQPGERELDPAPHPGAGKNLQQNVSPPPPTRRSRHTAEWIPWQGRLHGTRTPLQTRAPGKIFGRDALRRAGCKVLPATHAAP